MKPEELKEKAASIIGAGKSGVAAAGLLARAGARPFVSEFGAISPEAAKTLRQLGVPFEEGGHSARVFEAALCIVSPGIAQTAPVIRQMRERGIPVVSEIELASWFCPARIIGITGTDGKTTTATLLHRICEAEGERRGFRAFSVGNIGIPFSLEVSAMTAADIAVLELSSYQLEGCFEFRPNIAVLTNVTPDHMDRYGGSIEAYATAKFRIHSRQSTGDTLICNHDDPILRAHFDRREPWPFRVVRVGLRAAPLADAPGDFVSVAGGELVVRTSGSTEKLMQIDEIMKPGFRGDHNLYNVLSSVAAASAAGVSPETMRRVLAGFGGVEHRQEFAGTACGLDWINDSKATNVNALRQALQSVPAGMVLIAGGRDKGNDYSAIADIVREKVACIVAIGESREKIADAFRGVVTVHSAASLAEAVELARQQARPGASVLFSPACSSFDMFRDFEDRGRQFKQLVRELA
ncbi:UDP-N-acetylmuramoyl-L-alanine--D-glutamate ligase [Chlorobaculum sp. 24CR]|uniref:UDP-N-acetylmuramoyl-L-alanine--D-glutamate ligase n=1 Tax=Chlorobaculum sp. 24CR TaxID=2508878 RepID=UPI00100BCCC1|nr:UDP-N-acetylmuramoyl-L-alanine--D-glutamate ligase [Chlorobaculum sp. 24CR]RXK87771.1 UDP-N-acetylmuramoyl-L-alanine--D-glutamate ligase [Chlorobaculum sp. 24CR]